MKMEKQSQILKKIFIAVSCIGLALVFRKVPGYVADKVYYYNKRNVI